MAGSIKYKPKYGNSYAVVVGVNAYKHAPPLGYACNDATVFADQLANKFGFPSSKVTLLLDDNATLERIRAAIAELARATQDDDRVIIFYAGHGHTVSGNRREAGFLVPVGGNSDDTSTLLPWDELVSHGNLIRAKHVLYIMDACYSGLISTRKLAPGSARIARDMLSRYSRQYLTAGKADEVVADGGGPRKGHSMFTGHLLDGMDGEAASDDGIITANKLMAYVYDRVARDPRSGQSPHYGWLDGDGDLFFTDPKVDPDPTKEKDTNDTLVVVPPDLQAPEEAVISPPDLDQVKTYLSENRHRIQLNELVMRQLRTAQQRLGEDEFPVHGPIGPEDFAERLQKYEKAMEDLLRTTVLLGRWAEQDQQSVIRQVAHVLAGRIEVKSGLVVYLALRSYPMVLSMYAGGIGAVDGENYLALKTLFTTPVSDHRNGGSKTVLESTVNAMLDVDRSEAFKMLPGFDNKYVPRSEYLFTRMQPILEDILFLGSRYEQLFDRFELFYALCYADLTGRSWAPPGRFGWKYTGKFHGEDPFNELVEEAKRERDNWAPVKAGMFGGSSNRFLEVAGGFKAGLLDKLSWF